MSKARKARRKAGTAASIRQGTRKKPDGLVRLVLDHKCSVNGVYYGRGEVRVNATLAGTLRELDARAATEHARTFDPEPRAMMVFPGGRAVRVPADRLDDLLARALHGG